MFAGPAVVSPNFSVDRTVYWTSGAGQGIMVSLDSGKKFKQLKSPLSGDGTLILSPAYGSDGTLYYGGVQGLFRSKNRGKSWVKLRQRLARIQSVYKEAIALAPDYSSSRELLFQERHGTLFKCTDSGSRTLDCEKPDLHFPFDQLTIGINWETGKDHNVKIVYSPNFLMDSTVYSATPTALLRSEDRGRSWVRLPRRVRYDAGVGSDEATQVRLLCF